MVPMDRSDIDTDQLVPKQFLKRVERSGFGKFLFFDWRYLNDDYEENPSFELNQPMYRNATILFMNFFQDKNNDICKNNIGKQI